MGERLKSLMQEKSRLMEERDVTEQELRKLKEKIIENEEVRLYMKNSDH